MGNVRGMSEAGLDVLLRGPVHEVFPALHEAQSAWLAQIDSLQALDRKTHELVRMVCMVIARNPQGSRATRMLATEVGADWSEIVAAIALTNPASASLPAASRCRTLETRLRRGVRWSKPRLEE